MQLNTHVLEGELARYVESVFHFKDFVPDHSIERVVPTGHVYLIFELDGIPRHTFDNETLKPNKTFTRVWVSGMHRQYLSISAHQDSEMFVIQFKPYGAHPFFHFPIEEISDRVLPAEKVLGAGMLDFREELAADSPSEVKFKLAEKWLTGRFDPNRIPSRELLEVVERLQREPVANFNTIVKEYPMTPKHLIHQFKKYVGLTPKYYQRILRFNEILQLIHRSEDIEWSQVAYQCEYADQSHFIKEFRHFFGFQSPEVHPPGFS